MNSMKRTIHGLAIVLIMIVGCNKKAMPVITERKQDPPVPVKNTVAITPDLAKGKMIFINRCGRCHELHKPDQYTATRWEGILSYMGPRATLNEEQTVHITAYLKANAAK